MKSTYFKCNSTNPAFHSFFNGADGAFVPVLFEIEQGALVIRHLNDDEAIFCSTVQKYTEERDQTGLRKITVKTSHNSYMFQEVDMEQEYEDRFKKELLQFFAGKIKGVELD